MMYVRDLPITLATSSWFFCRHHKSRKVEKENKSCFFRRAGFSAGWGGDDSGEKLHMKAATPG